MTESLKSHMLNLYALALTDAQFDEREIFLLYRIAGEKGVPKEELDNLLLNPATLKFQFPDTVEQRIEYLYDYAKMIMADDHVDENETKTLEKFCLRFDFDKENTPAIVDLLITAAKNQVPNDDLIQFVHQQNN
jgi:hypothetical protein